MLCRAASAAINTGSEEGAKRSPRYAGTRGWPHAVPSTCPQPPRCVHACDKPGRSWSPQHRHGSARGLPAASPLPPSRTEVPARLRPTSAVATSSPRCPGDRLGKDPGFRGSLLPWEPRALCTCQKIRGTTQAHDTQSCRVPAQRRALLSLPQAPSPQSKAGAEWDTSRATRRAWDREARHQHGEEAHDAIFAKLLLPWLKQL